MMIIKIYSIYYVLFLKIDLEFLILDNVEDSSGNSYETNDWYHKKIGITACEDRTRDCQVKSLKLYLLS